jgi:dipeptidase E
MRFLLTSAGIKNASIHDALVDLLGKPIAESSALCIPTAIYAIPEGVGHAWRFISGREPRTPMCELGWDPKQPVSFARPWPPKGYRLLET